MSHVDDGQLNALLDGELDAQEAQAIQSHIADCAECATRLEEAKRFLAQAGDLLGALLLPQAVSVPEPARRQVSKTAKEVALDLDGATQKSPAIQPILRPPAGWSPRAAPAAGHRFDYTTLAWAAAIVLAVGVGYLANEVRHTPQGAASGGTDAAHAPPPTSAVATGAAAATGAPGARSAPAHERRSAGVARPAPAPGTMAAKPGGAAAGKRLAVGAGPAAPSRAERSRVAAAAGEPAAPSAGASVAGLSQAAQPRNQPAADRGGVVPDRTRLEEAPSAALAAAPTTFRRATLEQAVATLQGSIRLIDGMNAERVEVGPGSLVSGADQNGEVVRVIYADAIGHRIVLDQQRVRAAEAAAPRAREEEIPPLFGLRASDTLTTTAPNGQARVRWIDRGGFWLSLSGSLSPDSLRRLATRVR
jgi:hypothetical protein